MAYYSQKNIDRKKNYEIYDAELLIIIEIFCLWRHLFKRLNNTVILVKNYCNLWLFMTIHKLLQKQMRLAFDISVFDFWLIYCKGVFNILDCFSYQLDYQRNVELKRSMTDSTLAF